MTPPQTSHRTLDASLTWEAAQALRHEVVDGEVTAPVGASRAHNTLVLNLASMLQGQLRGRGCRTFAENVKLVAGERSFYPDVMVTCAHRDTDPQVVRHPLLITEVLSPIDEAYDRGKKWHEYQQRLPSLQTYLLVAQDEARVDLFRRSGEVWFYTTHAGLDAVIELADPACRLRLADVYEDVLGGQNGE